MKNLILTYSNGDREHSVYTGDDFNQAIDGLISTGFKCAWKSKDSEGNYCCVTNMTHVRSIEIIEDWKEEDDE